MVVVDCRSIPVPVVGDGIHLVVYSDGTWSKILNRF